MTMPSSVLSKSITAAGKPGEWRRLLMTQIKPGHKQQLELKLSVVCLCQTSARRRDGRYDQLNNFIKLHTVTLGQNQK